MLGQLEKNLTPPDRAEMGSEIAFEAQKRLKNGSKVKKIFFFFAIPKAHAMIPIW